MKNKLFCLRLILTALIFLVDCVCWGQDYSLPNIVPPPPDAASLGKYGDVPVNLSSGMANISIPLFNIKTAKLSLPISLSYYPSGIKVNDIASWVGLGWSLNAGGVITRAIRGRDDFGQKGYYTSATPPLAETLLGQNNWQFLQQAAMNLTDVEPDYFFYNFLEHSGKYSFTEDKEPFIISYQDPLKVQHFTDGYFVILDGQGNQFYFSDKEQTNSYYTTQADSPFPHNAQNYVSSWYLSKIVSYDKSETINFIYSTDPPLTINALNYSASINNYGNVYGNNGPSSMSFTQSAPLRLKEINFTNGKLVFYSSGSRLDLDQQSRLDSIRLFSYDNATRVYNRQRGYRFSYGNFTTVGASATDNPLSISSPGYRMRLESLEEIAIDNSQKKSHNFSYNGTPLPYRGSNAQDLFGYYNGKNNSGLIPQTTGNYDSYPYTIGGADRGANEIYTQAGILKQIKYPTGGYTNFDYEINRYADNKTVITPVSQSASATGQMNQNAQTTFVAPSGISGDAMVSITISSYNYPGVQTRPYASIADLTAGQTPAQAIGSPNNTTNITSYIPLVAGHTYQMIAGAFDNSKVFARITITWNQITTTPVITNSGGLRIKQVTNYDVNNNIVGGEAYRYGANENGNGNLTGPTFALGTYIQNTKTYTGTAGSTGSVSCVPSMGTAMTFNSSSLYDVFNLSNAQINYTEVAKYRLNIMGATQDKTVYNYSTVSNSVLPVPQAYCNGIYITNDGWPGSLLLSQTDYALRTGTFYPVKKVVNSYTNTQLKKGRGSKIGFSYSFSGCYDQSDPTWYYAFDYPIYSGAVQLSNVDTYLYDASDPTKYALESQHYVYENLDHLQPTSISSTTSDNKNMVTVIRYPADKDIIDNLTSTEKSVMDNLQNNHAITTVIQKTILKNNVGISTINHYRNNGAVAVPDYVEVKRGSGTFEKRIQFNNYDPSYNLTNVNKVGDASQSYIWGYQYSYPIAMVNGASDANIAATSFEEDGFGNWIANGNLINNGGLTGDKSYNGTLSKTVGLGQYTVTLWCNIGVSAPVVNGSQGTLTATRGNWRLYKWDLSGVNNITVQCANMDEVRLYPSGTQMTTYCYVPHVGMISQMDPSGHVVYFEYDALGRLKLTRDQDGNIIKSLEYKYQGQ
ncbi:RHS repeat domain-containing protein [Deminuibacter soli]|uniref:RHS repeat protein n=1 Tax=Deminuibacter soli TaxID=2291815 RepID=A0A3E1NG34_9BACT|nr:hypothetical protein [Deminuibacter soli]RFM26758.1 hypothetical protein DXN05_17335 [Deminuibacter soli]